MVTEDSDKMFYQMEKIKHETRTYETYKEHAEDMSFENDGKKDDDIQIFQSSVVFRKV